MQLHQLKPIHKKRRAKRIGRGGKRGAYSGRGSKGQKARAGRRLKPAIQELIKRYPKLRGYRFKSKIPNPKSKITVLNLQTLDKKFKAGEKITAEILLEKKLISKMKGKMPQVKILGRGKMTKKLIVEGCQISKAAREKIEKVGGKII